MIRPEQIWLVVDAVDMRGGIESLSQRIQNLLGRSPCDGTAYAFRNRRATRIKLLIWDGTGVWLCQRRLHRGRFVWPTPEMGLAGNGRGLATAGCPSAGAVAGVMSCKRRAQNHRGNDTTKRADTTYSARRAIGSALSLRHGVAR